MLILITDTQMNNLISYPGKQAQRIWWQEHCTLQYVSTSILTMMAFIAGSASTVSTETQEMPLNLYSIIFSLPTFGKTQTNKEYAISPMVAVFSKKDLPNTVIQKYTSSGLIKTVAHNTKGYPLSGKL